VNAIIDQSHFKVFQFASIQSDFLQNRKIFLIPLSLNSPTITKLEESNTQMR